MVHLKLKMLKFLTAYFEICSFVFKKEHLSMFNRKRNALANLQKLSLTEIRSSKVATLAMHIYTLTV